MVTHECWFLFVFDLGEWNGIEIEGHCFENSIVFSLQNEIYLTNVKFIFNL